MISWLAGEDVQTRLRRGVLALAALGIVGTTVELVFLRHWTTPTRLIVWPAMLALAAALGLLVVRATPRRVTAARAIAGVVLLVAGLGIALHVHGNLEAGPLDRHYAATWDTLSSVEQWWLASTGGVGPAPVLAPGALAEISLMLLLATVAHPVFAIEATPAGRFPGDRGVLRPD